MQTKHWVQASRPFAQVNIAVPLVLGQVAAWHVVRTFDWFWFVAALLWGILDHLFVVYANDYADHEADTGNRSLISGGSGVIPEGKLAPTQLLRAAQASAFLLIAWSGALALFGRPWTPAYAVIALALLWLYSFPPVRLSYRGGGEILQGLGIGIGLPSLGYYLQAEVVLAPMWIILPATVLGLCGNILTALPDVEDDRNADKRTWPVRYGVPHARRAASAGIAFAAFGVFLWTPLVPVGTRTLVGIMPLVPLLIGARAEDPFRAAWWASIALNVLLVSWILVMGLSP
ncbi:MAG: prenyltransferase [Myxococcales bacterium]|nr:prenyltransferase [Myxococcales bacterium]